MVKKFRTCLELVQTLEDAAGQHFHLPDGDVTE